MHQSIGRRPDQLLRLVAHRSAGGRHVEQRAVQGGAHDDVRGVLGQQAIARLAGGQVVQTPNLFGDILEQADQRDHFAVLVKLAAGLGLHDPDLVVGPHQPRLEAARLLVRYRPQQLRADQRAILGMEGVQAVLEVWDIGPAIDAMDIVDQVRPGQFAPDHVVAPVSDAGHGLGQLQQAGLFAAHARHAQMAHLVDDDTSQDPQTLQLPLRGARARPGVDDAKRAEVEALGRGQDRADIEAHARLAGHQRIGGETRVERRVLHDQHRVLAHLDGVAAERPFARRRPGVDAQARLEPLPLFVDQGDHGHGRVEQVARQSGHAIEGDVRRGVEDPIALELPDPSRFVVGHRFLQRRQTALAYPENPLRLPSVNGARRDSGP